MRSSRIVVLLEKLYKLDEQLGGNERKKNSKKPQKEFDQMLEDLKEDIEMITAKQKDREKRNQKYGNDDEAIRLGVDIRESIQKCESQFKTIEKNLMRQLKKPEVIMHTKQKYNPQELEARVTAFKLAKIALKGTKIKEFGVEEQEFKGVTLTQLKNQVFEDGTQNKQNHQYQEELSQEEQDAIKRWNLNDEHMDEQLDQIIQGFDQLYYKAQMMGQKIDQTNDQTQKLITEVDKTNKNLSNANIALKKLTQVYRRPNKFVLDIAFILLLLGLVATIITTFTKK